MWGRLNCIGITENATGSGGVALTIHAYPFRRRSSPAGRVAAV